MTNISQEYREVLIVEDDPISQRVAVGLIELLGYRADVAVNGAKAVEAFTKRRYDAILMDIHMPEMDGYEATVGIRRLEGDGRRTPIIAMTANTLTEDREKALAAGMDDYLTKPVNRKELEAALSRWTGRRRGMIQRLKERGGPELALRMTQAFLEETAHNLAELREAVDRRDDDVIRIKAHTLKGSAAAMGARELSLLAAKVEDADGSRLRRLVNDLEEEFRVTREAMISDSSSPLDV